MRKDKVGWTTPGGLYIEDTPAYCRICGGPVKAFLRRNRYDKENRDVITENYMLRNLTSGSDYCLVSIDLDPDYKPPWRTKTPVAYAASNWSNAKAQAQLILSNSHRRNLIRYTPFVLESADKTGILLALVEVHFDTSMWFVDNQWMGTDERGALDTYGRDESVWSVNSRVKIAMKVIGGQPALTIECPLHETPAEVLARELAGSGRFMSSYDYLFVWRCGCPRAHEIRYKTLDDLPTRYGYHDSCILCNNAPLEVTRPGTRRGDRR